MGLLGDGTFESASFLVFLVAAALFGLACRLKAGGAFILYILSVLIIDAVLDDEAHCNDCSKLDRRRDDTANSWSAGEDGLFDPKTLWALARTLLLSMFMVADHYSCSVLGSIRAAIDDMRVQLCWHE